MSSKNTSPPNAAARDSAKAPSKSRIRKAVAMADAACLSSPSGFEDMDDWYTIQAHQSNGAPKEARARVGMFVKEGKTEADLKKAHPVLHAAVTNDIEALKEAIARRPKEVNRAAISDNPELNSDRGNYSPLHMACFNDSPEAVSLLTRAGADAGRFLAGVTPVGLAAYSGALRALKALFENGADARLTLSKEHGEEGNTLLHRMMERLDSPRRHEVVRELILSGQYPDPLVKTAEGNSPIGALCEMDDRTARWLLSYAASLEALALSDSVKKTKPSASKPSPSL